MNQEADIKVNRTDLTGFQNITEDGGVRKKVMQSGFGIFPTEGQELTVKYISYLEDGRTIDNTHITKEPYVFDFGKNSLVPGIELALKKMKMGEQAKVYILPEYSFILQDRLKNSDSNMEEEMQKIKIELQQQNMITDNMDIKELRKYLPVLFEIELVKFDKHRKSKSAMEPDERVSEAAIIKNEGNDLFREKRYREAIVKYNTGLHYLHQMPTDFLTYKVHELRMQFNLNIINCHLSLCEYNYALKKLEEIFPLINPPPFKCFYYRCIAYMNLGEFEKAGSDFKHLRTLLPNDPLVKKLEDDFEKIKEKTFTAKKGIIKKGMFSAKLYDDIVYTKEISLLPKFDTKNKVFYIDLLIDSNYKDPKKLKFEIFSQSDAKVIQILNEEIKSKKLHKRNALLSSYNSKTILILDEVSAAENLSNVTNNFPPCEDFLLTIVKNEEEYKLAITLEKLSDNLLDELVVIGRCFYNVECLKKILEGHMANSVKSVSITNCDYL